MNCTPRIDANWLAQVPPPVCFPINARASLSTLPLQAAESFALTLAAWGWVRPSSLPRRADVLMFSLASACILHCYSDHFGEASRAWAGFWAIERPEVVGKEMCWVVWGPGLPGAGMHSSTASAHAKAPPGPHLFPLQRRDVFRSSYLNVFDVGAPAWGCGAVVGSAGFCTPAALLCTRCLGLRAPRCAFLLPVIPALLCPAPPAAVHPRQHGLPARHHLAPAQQRRIHSALCAQVRAVQRVAACGLPECCSVMCSDLAFKAV